MSTNTEQVVLGPIYLGTLRTWSDVPIVRFSYHERLDRVQFCGGSWQPMQKDFADRVEFETWLQSLTIARRTIL